VPVEPRDSARLLIDRGPRRAPAHGRITDLVAECRPGDVIVVNDTRVLPARLALRRETGGAVEALAVENAADGIWEVLLKPSRRIRVGETLLLVDGTPAAQVFGELGDGRWLLRWCVMSGSPVEQFLARHGEVPLPPYIQRRLDDPERYQTVYARRPASVAAPTAGLHLTTELLDRIRAAGVIVVPLELVVGLGTFRPITAERVEDHVMHAESYRLTTATAEAVQAAAVEGRRVLAVGTTVVRALESWAATGRLEGRTDLFIRPGYRFAVVNCLLTNFHVPRSSLLVLIDAFVGDRWRFLYEDALRNGYRFLSLGDAMLLDRHA
jgi:S-adenosylmethionine:tRNA ribosyltransferase-isomerase